MSTYKVGDKVKITGRSISGRKRDPGMSGTVAEIGRRHGELHYRVRTKPEHGGYLFPVESISHMLENRTLNYSYD